MSLFSGQTFSNLGEQLYLIAIPWLVYEMTQSTLTMGTVAAIIAFPQIIFGLIIGVVIDRFNKRKIMMYSTVLQVILMTLLPTLYLSNALSIYHIYIICFLYSLGSLIFLSTYRSALPQLVERTNLVKANSLIQSSLTIIRVIGPIIAGILIANFGVHNALYVNMFSFIILYLVLINIKFPNEKRQYHQKVKTTMIREIKEGIQFIFSNKSFLHINILSFFVNMGMAMSLSMMVFYLHGDYDFTAQQVGYVFAISGAMAFLFSIIAPALVRYFNQIQAILLSCALSGFGLIFITFSSHWLVIGLFLGCITGGTTLASIYIYTFFQHETPENLLGRVFTTSQMLARISTPLAVFFGGWFTHYFIHISQLFLFSGVIIILTIVVATIILRSSKKFRKVAV